MEIKQKKKWYQVTASDVMGLKKKKWGDKTAKRLESIEEQREKNIKRIEEGRLTPKERKWGKIVAVIVILLVMLLLWVIWEFVFKWLFE